MSQNYPDHMSYLEHLPPEVLKTIDASGQVAQSLERQDLEGELTRLGTLDTPFYNRLTKVLATAYTHEYRVVTGRHDKIGYAAYRDGGVPRVVEVDVAPRRTLPTLIGHRINITELAVATTKAGVQTAEQTAQNEKMVAVMEETEYLNFHGDRSFGSTDFSNPTNLQYDGIENQVKRGAPMNIIDMKGQPLSLRAFWRAENQVYQSHGMARPDEVFISPVDKINLQSSFYQLALTNQAERAAGVLGADAQTYLGAYGESKISTSRFLGDFEKFSDMGFGNTGGDSARPAEPTISTGLAFTPASGNATDGESIGLPAGDYQYAVKAANFFGESAAVRTAAVTSTDALGEATFEVTASAATKWLIVYRADAGGEFKFLKRVPVHSGTGVTEVTDNGFQTFLHPYGKFTYRQMPGTGFAAGVDFNTTAMAQWIPLERVALPQTLNRDWVIRHVSSLYSRAPEFNFLIINIGQTTVL